MQIIGLTGGSGTGKSTVGKRLVAQGAGHVDADAVYRTLCAESAPMLAELQQAFGGVLTETGTLNRPVLAKIVFADPAQLQRLNAITTPYIRKASLEAIQAQSACGIVLYDAPTLFETGAEVLCNAVIGVIAPYEARLRRIMARDKLSRTAATARIAAQPDDAFYQKRCTYLIQNDGDLLGLYAQTDQIYQQIQKQR